jgi:hypothetical protein
MIRAFIILLIFTGCTCYKGPVSEYGFFRKDIKPKNFAVDERIYDIIDTTVVYEMIGYINLNNNMFYLYENHKLGYSYLKFYANGKVSAFRRIRSKGESFILNPEPQLSRNDFDPAKSSMGYFFIDDDDKLILIFFFRHRNCYGYVDRSEFIIKNDTLIQMNIQTIDGKDLKVLNVKKNIPIEFIEGWKPDW